MNPAPSEPAHRPSDVKRRVLCRFYDQCLDHALSLQWPGFHCRECRGFEFEHDQDPDWWQEQAVRSWAILIGGGYIPQWIIDSYDRLKVAEI